MTDYLRVKDNETGHEYTVASERYDATPGLFTKVDKPATDSANDPLPPKYRTTVAKKAAENRATEPATEKGSN